MKLTIQGVEVEIADFTDADYRFVENILKSHFLEKSLKKPGRNIKDF